MEFCNSIKSIKYICKYIYKGCDLAVFGVTNEILKNDEVTQYQLGRYISSNEAAWHIFRFPIHERYPAVSHLSIHLENGQRIYFTKENAKNKIENLSDTTLTAFFKLCQKDQFAQTLLYNEIMSYYTWNAKQKIFCKRKKGILINKEFNIRKADTIGRVYTIHPHNSECYFLRMLLHHIRGPKSFEDLKTIDGKLFPTYREACLELGLLENDNHWHLALQEASLTKMPKEIRNLFAMILTTCNPSNPKGTLNFKITITFQIYINLNVF